MFIDLILQSGPGREAVGDANLLDLGRIDHVQIKVLRCERAGLNVIFDAFGQAGEEKLKSGATRLRLHGNLLPLRGTLEASEELGVIGLQPTELGGNQLIGIAPHGGISRRHAQCIDRRDDVRAAGPNELGAMAEIARPGDDEPDQNSQRGQANGQRSQQARIGNELIGLSVARDFQRVGSQQVEEGLLLRLIAFRVGNQALLELREGAFRFPGRAPRIQPVQRESQTEADHQGQRDKQDDARGRQGPGGEGIVIGEQDQNDREGQRHRGEDGGSAQDGADTQALLHLLDIGVQVIPSVHGSSRDIVRYWLESKDSASVATSRSRTAYHQRL